MRHLFFFPLFNYPWPPSEPLQFSLSHFSFSPSTSLPTPTPSGVKPTGLQRLKSIECQLVIPVQPMSHQEIYIFFLKQNSNRSIPTGIFPTGERWGVPLWLHFLVWLEVHWCAGYALGNEKDEPKRRAEAQQLFDRAVKEHMLTNFTLPLVKSAPSVI